MAQLFWGEVHGVTWDRQQMKPRDAWAAVKIAELVAYLQRHQEQLDYWFARKGGYPIPEYKFFLR